MGNVSGKLEDGPTLYLRDQSRRMHPGLLLLRVVAQGSQHVIWRNTADHRLFVLFLFYSVNCVAGGYKCEESDRSKDCTQLVPEHKDPGEERVRRR